MFAPEKEVPNFELCLKLKGLGYPQAGGGWYWVYDKHLGEIENLVHVYEMTDENIEHNAKYGYLYVKAPTVRELGEWLPDHLELEGLEVSPSLLVKKYWYIESPQNPERRLVWCVCYDCGLEFKSIAESEADSRAKMLIWLVENGYISFERR